MESHSKTCTKCNEVKPRTEFSKDRKAKGGLRSQCKACYKQYSKRWHQENRERRLEYKKQYRQENREQILESQKQYYQENREYYKQYYQENREQRLEYNRQWRQENREYYKQYYQENREQYLAYGAKRRALKCEAVPEALANCPEEKDRVDKIYKLRELLTKATGIEYHVDHIWPLSKGGPHWSGNLQIITAEENLSKRASFCEDTARVIEESLHEYLSARQ